MLVRTSPSEFHNTSFNAGSLDDWQPGTTRGGHDHPAAQALLETDDDPSGWLRRVRPAVSAQACESEVRIPVHKTSVFSAQRQMSREGIISAAAVQEGTRSLRAGASHRSAKIARGIKDQTAAPGERVSADPSDAQWKFHHQISSNCVHVGLDSGFSKAAEISLSISIESIVPFGREPTVDVIAVSDLESAGVCGGPRDSLSVRVLGEKACALQTDL